MRVLHTDIWHRSLQPVRDAIAARGLDVELVPLGAGPGEALLTGTALPEALFEQAEQAGVRWIQTMTVGMEDVITPALQRSDVALTTVGGLAVEPIAEFVLARLLAHVKDLDRLGRLQQQRRWEPMSMLGSLAGATLTVVGLGPIGRRVAELGVAFRMHVIGVRRRPEDGAGPCHEVVGPDALADVAARSDHLVLALPLTSATAGMLGRRELEAVKDGCLIVNVGRGPLVDEEALLEALRSGRISAALDVVAEEPLPPDSPLWDAPGVSISPHCASITDGLFTEMAGIIVDNIERFRRGRPLRNLVDTSLGYPPGS